jgi:hypothetical protein
MVLRVWRIPPSTKWFACIKWETTGVLFGLLWNLDLVAYAQSIVPDIRLQDEDTAR